MMKNELPNEKTIYSSIINGDTSPSDLNDAELSALFDYLCTELEKGNAIDNSLMEFCAERSGTEIIGDCEKIIRNTYKKLAIKPAHIRKRFLRRTVIAAFAACIFALSCFFTAFSLNIDLSEKLEALFTGSKEDTGITVIDYRDPAADGKYTVTKFHGLNRLFITKFRNYLYPSRLPAGTKATKASDYGDANKSLISLQINNQSDEVFCTMTAKDANQAHLPMGYKYTAFCDGQKLDFVYTLSRKNADVIKYTLYTVYDGVQYTFHINIGDWSKVTEIIANINLP